MSEGREDFRGPRDGKIRGSGGGLATRPWQRAVLPTKFADRLASAGLGGG